jgi:hypothetical protein
VTTVETTTKPIEVLLSRPHLEVTCRIVFPDGTAIAVGVDALSLRGAQQEMTAWLIERGYEPAGRWSTQYESERRAARTFRRQDPGPVPDPGSVPEPGPPRPDDFSSTQDPADALPDPPPGAPRRSPPGPGLDPARGPARFPPPRTRGPAPASRAKRGAGRGRTSSPQAAETELRAWAAADAQRDDVIREAAAAGVSLPRIQEITGIARTTIMRILGSPPRQAPRRPS